MLARRFLWVVAGLIVILLAGALAYRVFERQLFEVYFVPSAAFEAALPPPPSAYAARDMWIARPDIAGNPALWLPPGTTAGAKPRAALFFIHPTSYLERSRWNAPIADVESQQRAALFVRHQASPFSSVASIWAPKYRQAAFGAFLTTKQDAERALDLAYRDVLAAFDAFVAQAPKDAPIILAGHSQGSLHLTHLLRDRVAGKPIARRIVAAYAIGWPISTTADLPTLGLPACETRADAGCLVSWQSFSEPADTKMVTDAYDASIAPGGLKRAGSPMLCVNPITGVRGGVSPAAANPGTLMPNADLTQGTLLPGIVPAACGVAGFLSIGGNPPALPPYVLPGNNYHVFDYALFWASVRADAEARLAAFLAK